jgi:hypothetical protein
MQASVHYKGGNRLCFRSLRQRHLRTLWMRLVTAALRHGVDMYLSGSGGGGSRRREQGGRGGGGGGVGDCQWSAM